jgi:hypothetical protein
VSAHSPWQSETVSRRWAGVVLALSLVVAACSGGGGSGDLERRRADPSGRVVLGDDLSTNASRWREVDEADASVELDTGDLVIETTRIDEPVVASPVRAGIDLFDTETAIELGTLEGRGERGVACRVADGDWYSFTLDDAGMAVIALWSEGERTVLASSTYEDDPARLAGRCIGGVEGGDVTLLLIIDGLEIAVATDETGLGPGAPAVVARAVSDEEPIVARATRFEVRELSGGVTRREPAVSFGPLPPDGFADSFDGEDGPFGELPVDVTGDFAAAYDGGTYRLRADGFIQRSAPVDPLPDRAIASVTIIKVSQGPGWSGLKWAYDEDHYYEVVLDDGAAEISVVDGDRSAAVVLASAADVEAIEGRGEPNRATSEMTRTDDEVRITLVVNDVPVLTATDEDRFGTLRFSQLFVRRSDDSTEPVEARFDDYSLRAA